MKHFVIEVEGDCSFFERVGGRKRFRYRTKSEFIRFRSSPQRAESNAALHLARFLKENFPYPLITIYFYEEVPEKSTRVIWEKARKLAK
jgi:hypothetical protein